MTIFFAVFLGVFAALFASQLLGWLIFYIWWTEPFKRKPEEPKPQATYKESSHA